MYKAYNKDILKLCCDFLIWSTSNTSQSHAVVKRNNVVVLQLPANLIVVVLEIFLKSIHFFWVQFKKNSL